MRSSDEVDIKHSKDKRLLVSRDKRLLVKFAFGKTLQKTPKIKQDNKILWPIYPIQKGREKLHK